MRPPTRPKFLDKALFRRFDDALTYHKPGPDERKQLIANVLSAFKTARFAWKQVLKESEGLSQAEVDYACKDAVKSAILSNRIKVEGNHLISTLRERRNANDGIRR